MPSSPYATRASGRGACAARLKVIKGAGHLPMLERPEEFNAELLGFLDGRAQRVNDR